jgi:hypothetical protein
MALRLSDLTRDVANIAVNNFINSGVVVPRGYIEIRTGNMPSSPLFSATGILLATLQLNDPPFASFANGIAVAGPIDDGTAIAAGTAGWFRLYNRDRLPVLDGTAGFSGSDLELAVPALTIGMTIHVSALSMIMVH